MRKLLIGVFLFLVGVAIILPKLVDQRIPAKLFYGPNVVRLYSHQEERIHYLQLEDYIVGVVAAEMPASFPEEALKAQAVCARTYLAKRIGGKSVRQLHPGADICDDPLHGQAWASRNDLKNKWGLVDYYRYYYNVRQAVLDTAGQVLAYDGVLIDSAYHAACGGMTENAEDVWQTALPYLRSVVCPYEEYPKIVQMATFNLGQIDEVFGTYIHAMPVSGGNHRPVEIKVTEETATGRPKNMLWGDQQLSSVAIREQLGLRSTNFTWSLENDTITITTTGYGHGVGLCQYGAKGLAEQGYNYRIILGHYYSGVEIVH